MRLNKICYCPLRFRIGSPKVIWPKQILADAGYWSESNVAEVNSRAIDPYIATRRIKHSELRAPLSSEPMPEGLTLKQRMEHKLSTAEGRAVYALRKTIPEPWARA